MPVLTGAEKLAPTVILSPDRPARSVSLYRLSYPGPIYIYILFNTLLDIENVEILRTV